MGCMSQIAFSQIPQTISGPSPAIQSTYNVGDTVVITYAITNNVPPSVPPLPLSISGYSGPVTHVTAQTNDCNGRLLPQSTCNIAFQIAPTSGDSGKSFNQIINIDYKGRTPFKLPIAFSVAAPSYTAFAYIADLGLSSSGSLDFCAQDSTGLLVGSTCATTGSGVTFQNPVATAINPAHSNQIFVVDSGGTYGNIYACTINANGSVSGCGDTGFATQMNNYVTVRSFAFAKAASIAINSTGTVAYITDGNNTGASGGDVVYAPITSGSFGTINSACDGDNCSNSSGLIYLGSANNIALNSGATKAYIASNQNGQNGVYQCAISSNTFSSCALTGGGNLTSPLGIALNSGGTYAYVTNASSSAVAVCPISSGTLSSSCNTPTVGTNLVGIGLNAAGTYAYVTSYNGSDTTNSFVYSCPISGSTLGSCTPTSSFTSGFSFSKPNSVSAS